MPKDLSAESSTIIPATRAAGAPRWRPALTIASHPVAERVGARLVLDAISDGQEILLSRNEPDFLPLTRAPGAPLADPFVSRRPIRLSPAADGGVKLASAGGGALVVDGEPVRGAVVVTSEEIARGVAVELAERVVLVLHRAYADDSSDALGMIGESAGLVEVRRHVERVADVLVPVLIRGETGTGKELCARALHAKSHRSRGPFVSVNLGAVPRELAAAELFGAQRGAYTGATRDREGYFRAARGGTLFLDEIGEAPPEVQVMLLRALETGEVVPVGADAPMGVDVRLVAATDADLEQHIRDGHFKAPLLHRLAGYEIRLPPLRERREDIGPLFYHFAREELAATGELHLLAPADPRADAWLPAPLATRLIRHAWPGNIRQLRNVTRQLVIGSRGLAQLELDARLAEELDAGCSAVRRSTPSLAPRRKPSEVSEAELVAALRESGWDFKAAADRLGIPRPSIYDLVEKSPGLRTAGDLSAEEIARAYREHQGDIETMARRLEVSARALKRRIKELKLG